MKRYIALIAVVFSMSGCGGVATPEGKEILAEVDDYEISIHEFEAEFRNSHYGTVDTAEARRQFLDTLIDRKLILQDAQRQSVDKDASFLKMIERFWEQSLLKLMLEKKTREIARATAVTEHEIEEAYGAVSDKEKLDKTYAQMHDQLRWDLTKRRESQMMDEWIADLHKRATIKIHEVLLKRD